MPDQKPMLVYAATYNSVSDAETALDAIEQLHKDEMIGSYDAAVIDKETASPTSSSGRTARGSPSSPRSSAPGPCRAKSSTRPPRISPPARQG